MESTDSEEEENNVEDDNIMECETSDSDFLFQSNSNTANIDIDNSDSGEELDQNAMGKRKRGRPVGSKKIMEHEIPVAPRKRKTEMLSPLKYGSFFCCLMLCLCNVSTESVLSIQENFNSLTNSEKSQWILDWLWGHHSYVDGQFAFKFSIGISTVCLTAWLAVLGIPMSTFYSIRQRFQNGEKVMPVKGKSRGTMSMESLNCITWLQEYAQFYAEKLPFSNQLHLPPCLTKKSVYEIMSEELQDQGIKVVSETYFISNLWNTYCSNIKIPPVSRFSKCDTCTLLKQNLAETKSKEKRKKLFEARRKHLEKQSKERQKYYKHGLKSRKEPGKYMSIIIDGMDQQKTYLPNFVLLSKCTSGMWRLRTHLVGLIVHGIGIYGFFDIFQWPHSTNLTLSILLQVFLMLKDSLPDTLYLQMDNCSRENKNRFVFAFFTWLVEIGIFKKVKINFLMVGHTHEDIDQVFSRLSTWLARFAAMTLPKLMQAFEKCYTPNPTAIEMDHVFNITEWLDPHIEKIQGHSRPHCFKIVKDNGNTKLFYKNWSTDKIWEDATKNSPLLKSMPKGIPQLLESKLDGVDLKRVEDAVNNCIKKQFIKKEEDIAWWNDFFKKQDANEVGMQQHEWPVDEILINKLKNSADVETEHEDDIYDFIETKETPVNIVIGRPQKRTSHQEI